MTRARISLATITLLAVVVLGPPGPAFAGEASTHTTPMLVQDPARSHSDLTKKWIPPLGYPLTVSGKYRAPLHPYGAGHRGIDLPGRPGKSVLAPAAGTVAFVGTVVDRGVLTIRVDEHTVYSVEPVTSALAHEAAVPTGAILGAMATGGHCADECVHLGVRVDGVYVNPMRYFLTRPRLLPW